MLTNGGRTTKHWQNRHDTQDRPLLLLLLLLVLALSKYCALVLIRYSYSLHLLPLKASLTFLLLILPIQSTPRIRNDLSVWLMVPAVVLHRQVPQTDSRQTLLVVDFVQPYCCCDCIYTTNMNRGDITLKYRVNESEMRCLPSFLLAFFLLLVLVVVLEKDIFILVVGFLPSYLPSIPIESMSIRFVLLALFDC